MKESGCAFWPGYSATVEDFVRKESNSYTVTVFQTKADRLPIVLIEDCNTLGEIKMVSYT